MVTREQVMHVLNKLKANKPTMLFSKVDETSVGMNFILLYLSENAEDVYASTIADKMEISRARVAVLIQKLINRGLIEKQESNHDARIAMLKLTKQGQEEIKHCKDHMISNVTKVIEEVGIDEVYKFIETSAKIKNILDELE